MSWIKRCPVCLNEKLARLGKNDWLCPNCHTRMSKSKWGLNIVAGPKWARPTPLVK